MIIVHLKLVLSNYTTSVKYELIMQQNTQPAVWNRLCIPFSLY